MTDIKEQIERLRSNPNYLYWLGIQEAADTMEKMLAENERLQAEIYRKNKRIGEWKKCADEFEAENEKLLAVVEAARLYLSVCESLSGRELAEALAALEEDDE